eukprot:375065_1
MLTENPSQCNAPCGRTLFVDTHNQTQSNQLKIPNIKMKRSQETITKRSVQQKNKLKAMMNANDIFIFAYPRFILSQMMITFVLNRTNKCTLQARIYANAVNALFGFDINEQSLFGCNQQSVFSQITQKVKSKIRTKAKCIESPLELRLLDGYNFKTFHKFTVDEAMNADDFELALLYFLFYRIDDIVVPELEGFENAVLNIENILHNNFHIFKEETKWTDVIDLEGHITCLYELCDVGSQAKNCMEEMLSERIGVGMAGIVMTYTGHGIRITKEYAEELNRQWHVLINSSLRDFGTHHLNGFNVE